MARTKAYDRQIYNAVKSINRRLMEVEKTLGKDSEQYQRYINSITAAVPSSAYNFDPATGKIRMKTGKAARGDLKIGQIRPTLKNPTAKQSITATKKQIATTKAARGEIAKKISDEEALAELAAKQKLQDFVNEKGKLNYNDAVRSDMSTKGKKTYVELLEIHQKGQKIEQRREKQREYYARNKERINERRRARRKN